MPTTLDFHLPPRSQPSAGCLGGGSLRSGLAGKDGDDPMAPCAARDGFWLDQGKKMMEASLAAVRGGRQEPDDRPGAASGIYLGTLGFAAFIPKTMPLLRKVLFIIPLLCWLAALYYSLQVMLTQRLEIFLHSPEDIRQKSGTVLEEKQRQLQHAFRALSLGLIAAFVLLGFRLSFYVAPEN